MQTSQRHLRGSDRVLPVYTKTLNLEISQSYELEEALKPKNVSGLDLKDFLSTAREYLQETLESGK